MGPPSRAPVSRPSADRKVRTMLRVRLLGGLALEADGGPLEPPSSRPARELLAWLALHPGTHPRLELAMRFWPDVPEASARASLRTALHEVRRTLGDAHLAADRERVGLVDVTTDLTDLDAEEVLTAGEPLAGIDRDWVIAARDEHRERVSALLGRLSDGPQGLRWAREAVKHDPLSEEAAKRLMTLLAAAGDRAAAMSVYVRLEDRLERELSVAPSRQTRRLLAEIRTGSRSAARYRDDARLPPTKGRFAGRDAELQAADGRDRRGPAGGRAGHRQDAAAGRSRPDPPSAPPDRPLRTLLRGAGGAVRAVRRGARRRHIRAAARRRPARAMATVRGDRHTRRGDGAAARRPPLGGRRHAAAARAPPAPPEAAGRARRVPRHRDRPDPPARRTSSPTCAATASSSACRCAGSTRPRSRSWSAMPTAPPPCIARPAATRSSSSRCSQPTMTRSRKGSKT